MRVWGGAGGTRDGRLHPQWWLAKVGRLGPPDVSQPVLRDVSLRGIDMGHTDGRFLSCRDPVLLVRVKEKLRGDRQSRPVEGPLLSGSLCLHELGGDMQHCLLEIRYGVHSQCLVHLLSEPVRSLPVHPSALRISCQMAVAEYR